VLAPKAMPSTISQVQRFATLNLPSYQKLSFGRITTIAISPTVELSKALITERVRKWLVFSQNLSNFHLNLSSLVLLSLHTILVMVLEELKALVYDMSSVFHKDPDYINPAHSLPDLEETFSAYRNLAFHLKNETLRLGVGEMLVSEAYAALETDYSHCQISWGTDSASKGMDETIANFQELGHHTFAHVLYMKKLLNQLEVTDVQSRRLIQSRDHFLTEVKEALERDDLKDLAPSILRNSQIFMPTKLLKNLIIMDHIVQVNMQDCLGRSISHLLWDAGFLVSRLSKDNHHFDVLGRSAAYIACKHGKIAWVKSLIKEKVDFKRKASNGLAPLHIAASMGFTAICELLWKSQIYTYSDVRDRYGRSPLLWAALHGHKATVKFFYDLGCLKTWLTESDNSGFSALVLATCGYHTDVVKYILQTKDSSSSFSVRSRDVIGHSVWYYVTKDTPTELIVLLSGVETQARS
jgi:ankyrin repeat protein